MTLNLRTLISAAIVGTTATLAFWNLHTDEAPPTPERRPTASSSTGSAEPKSAIQTTARSVPVEHVPPQQMTDDERRDRWRAKAESIQQQLMDALRSGDQTALLAAQSAAQDLAAQTHLLQKR